MARSRTSAAVRPRERTALLATKLDIPGPRSDRLVRSRLIEALDARMVRALTLVCMPAGFGKTTLLADWARGAKWPVAWLSLDPEDNDPARFRRYVAAAVDRASRPARERGRPILGSRPPASSADLVTGLINKLSALPGDLALVLDDYHLLETGSVHDDMAYLLDHLPRRLHVFIASRSEPPLPLLGCGPGISWPSCEPGTSDSRLANRQRSSGKCEGSTCRRPPSPPLRPERKDGIEHAEHGFDDIQALPSIEVPTDGGMVTHRPREAG